MIKKKIHLLHNVAVATLLASASQPASAAVEYDVRAGWSVGGVMPLGMPASIRTLHSYSLRPNFYIGPDVHYAFDGHWGIMAGLHLEHKSMKTDAGVKGYHMKIVRGGEEMEGVFTGSVVTRADQYLLTLPVQATFALGSQVRLKLGPYVSYALSNKFDGWAYDGYVRRQEEGHQQGDPTGQKVELGHDEGQRGEYDFSGDLRRWQVGADFGVDWNFCRHWGVSADLTWALTPAFSSGFTVIEQKMYAIYGNIGVMYRF